jgi:hypothetical protein
LRSILVRKCEDSSGGINLFIVSINDKAFVRNPRVSGQNIDFRKDFFSVSEVYILV